MSNECSNTCGRVHAACVRAYIYIYIYIVYKGMCVSSGQGVGEWCQVWRQMRDETYRPRRPRRRRSCTPPASPQARRRAAPGRPASEPPAQSSCARAPPRSARSRDRARSIAPTAYAAALTEPLPLLEQLKHFE